MLTPQQRQQIAEKGNEFLLQVYGIYEQDYPSAKQAGVQLTFEQKQEMLIDSFKTVLQKVKETDPTILTDPYFRKILTKPPSTLDWKKEMTWNLAIQNVENALKLGR